MKNNETEKNTAVIDGKITENFCIADDFFFFFDV